MIVMSTVYDTNVPLDSLLISIYLYTILGVSIYYTGGISKFQIDLTRYVGYISRQSSYAEQNIFLKTFHILLVRGIHKPIGYNKAVSSQVRIV